LKYKAYTDVLHRKGVVIRPEVFSDGFMFLLKTF